MPSIAIIGGSGLASMAALDNPVEKEIETPYGAPSSSLCIGEFAGAEVVFLPRHGNPHCIPPHLVNYRANIWALHHIGVKKIISVNAVGGITNQMEPDVICIPDQVVDYTSGRQQTFFDGIGMPLDHIDFSFPFTHELVSSLTRSADQLGFPHKSTGVYGCTQGPRLETAAEIERLKRDGCDIVGMTLMPEAALARELKMEYASLSLVVNWAAGCTSDIITMDEINAVLAKGMRNIVSMLKTSIADISK